MAKKWWEFGRDEDESWWEWEPIGVVFVLMGLLFVAVAWYMSWKMNK